MRASVSCPRCGSKLVVIQCGLEIRMTCVACKLIANEGEDRT